jgi:hypothetical protein
MLKVTVTFDDTIMPEFQGPLLLAMEKLLRTSTQLDIRVFKDRLGDDSKLRMAMTPSEREAV